MQPCSTISIIHHEVCLHSQLVKYTYRFDFFFKYPPGEQISSPWTINESRTSSVDPPKPSKHTTNNIIVC